MRYVFIFLLAFSLAAQEKPKYDPKQTPEKIAATMRGNYAYFTITTIPRTCKHLREVNGAQLCRIYVRYPKDRAIIGRPVFLIEDWTDEKESDHSHNPDTIYHVCLIKPTREGVYIEGIPGHKIWWQVNSQ